MIIKIYDYCNKSTDIVIPDDKQIESIFVTIYSGDETGIIKLTDGSFIEFDASDNRIMTFDDGSYIVKGTKNINAWIKFIANNMDDTMSYERQRRFTK